MLHDTNDLITASYFRFCVCKGTQPAAEQPNVTVQQKKNVWISCRTVQYEHWHWVEFIVEWTRGCTFSLTEWFVSIDVAQFLGSMKASLGSLLERYTGAEITDKLGSSILATVFRQLVTHFYLLIFNCLATMWVSVFIDCNIVLGRWFYSWSCALWTSLTVCCWRASLLWSSYSKA